MELDPTQREALHGALLAAFPQPSQLKMMVDFKLDANLDEFTSGALIQRVHELIEWARKEGRLDDLVAGAIAQVPGNPRLKEFVRQHYRLAPRSGARQLQRIVREKHPFLDPEVHLGRMSAAMRCVCLIHLNRKAIGTGFLVGENLVMTCQHVVADVIARKTSPSAVRLIFDHRVPADGSLARPGTPYKLAPDWLVASSPPSPIDQESDARSGEPSLDELDFALLRVDGAPGAEIVDGEPRGVLRPGGVFSFPDDGPLYIVQHPNGEPQQVALDFEAILGVTTNRSRVRYRTNTMPGSSGSPCFNGEWELVAMHHTGDASFKKPSWNEGIPIDSIATALGGSLTGATP